MSSSLPQPQGFRLGKSTYYPDLLRIVRAGETQRISPKACAVLDRLIAAPGRVIARREILDAVWKDSFPTDDVLTHAITELRRALGDAPSSPTLIETIPRAGYRLLQAPQPVRAQSRGKSLRLPVAAALIATAAALGYLASPIDPEPTSSPPSPSAAEPDLGPDPTTSLEARPVVSSSALPSASLGSARTIATASSLPFWPAWSANARYLAFAVADDSAGIKVQGLDGRVVAEIATPGGLRDVSPLPGNDGSFVIYQRFDAAHCRVERFDVALGAASRLVDGCYGGSAMDLSDDERLLAYSSYVNQSDTPANQRNVALFLLDLLSGERRRLTYAERPTRHDFLPRFDPDGRRIAFIRTGRRHDRFLMIQALDSQRAERVVTHSWITDLDWVNARTMIVTAHRARRDVMELLDAGSGQHQELGAAPAFAVRFGAGQVLWSSGDLRTRIAVQDLSSGELGRATYSRQRDFHPAIAPDGRRLAFVSTRTGVAELLIKDLHTGEVRFLTSNPGAGPAHPSFHPHGESVVFVFTNDKGSAVWSADLSSGQLSLLVGGPGNVLRAQYDPEGNWLYFVSDRTGSWQLWRGALDRAPEQLTEDGADHFQVARDGTVYHTRPDQPGLYQVGLATPVLADFLGGPQSWIVDDGTLYYLPEGDPENLTQARLGDLTNQTVRAATGFSQNLSIDWVRRRAYFERLGRVSAQLNVAPLNLAAP